MADSESSMYNKGRAARKSSTKLPAGYGSGGQIGGRGGGMHVPNPSGEKLAGGGGAAGRIAKSNAYGQGMKSAEKGKC